MHKLEEVAQKAEKEMILEIGGYIHHLLPGGNIKNTFRCALGALQFSYES